MDEITLDYDTLVLLLCDQLHISKQELFQQIRNTMNHLFESNTPESLSLREKYFPEGKPKINQFLNFMVKYGPYLDALEEEKDGK